MLDAAAVRQSWRNWWSFSIHSTGPVWLQVLWTILFNTAFALLLTLLVWVFGKPADLMRLLTQNFVIAQSIGLTIHALFEAGAQAIGHDRVEAFATPARLVFYIGIPVVGVLIGYGFGLTLLGLDPIRIVQETPRVVMAAV